MLYFQKFPTTIKQSVFVSVFVYGKLTFYQAMLANYDTGFGALGTIFIRRIKRYFTELLFGLIYSL